MDSDLISYYPRTCKTLIGSARFGHLSRKSAVRSHCCYPFRHITILRTSITHFSSLIQHERWNDLWQSSKRRSRASSFWRSQRHCRWIWNQALTIPKPPSSASSNNISRSLTTRKTDVWWLLCGKPPTPKKVLTRRFRGAPSIPHSSMQIVRKQHLFLQQRDCTGQRGLTILQKCTVAMLMVHVGVWLILLTNTSELEIQRLFLVSSGFFQLLYERRLKIGPFSWCEKKNMLEISDMLQTFILALSAYTKHEHSKRRRSNAKPLPLGL